MSGNLVDDIFELEYEDCDNCDDSDCPAHPDYKGEGGSLAGFLKMSPEDVEEIGAEKLRELSGRPISLEELKNLDIPDHIKDKILAQVADGTGKEGTSDGTIAGNTNTMMEATNQEIEILEELAQTNGTIIQLEHEIHHRRTGILKRLMDGDGLGRNDTERKINMDAALENDEQLYALSRMLADEQRKQAVLEQAAKAAHRQVVSMRIAVRTQTKLREIEIEKLRLKLDSLGVMKNAIDEVRERSKHGTMRDD
jgi:hypothetical protein